MTSSLLSKRDRRQLGLSTHSGAEGRGVLFVDCLWVENLSGCVVGNRQKKKTKPQTQNKHRGDTSGLCNPYPTTL